jgi:hypothetical protein
MQEMGKKIIIHIGTGKTGSSSIQKSLSHAADEGLLYDITYPKIQKKKFDHEFLAISYKPFSKLPRVIRTKYAGKENILEKDRVKYRRQFLNILNKSQKVILSSEYLTNFNPEEISLLKNDLRELGYEDIKIVVYVRKPSSYYLSFIQQQLKASKCISDPRTFSYPFKKTICNWHNFFPGKIIVKPFDITKLKNNCVVQDFLHTISQTFEIDIDHNIKICNLNSSMSAEAMVIMQKYRRIFYNSKDNIFMKDSSKLFNILVEIENQINQTKPMLKKDVGKLVVNNHVDDLKWLNQHYGITFDKENSSISNIADITDIDNIADIRESNLDDILRSYDNDILIDVLYHALNKGVSHKSSLKLKKGWRFLNRFVRIVKSG